MTRWGGFTSFLFVRKKILCKQSEKSLLPVLKLPKSYGQSKDVERGHPLFKNVFRFVDRPETVIGFKTPFSSSQVVNGTPLRNLPSTLK